jgi:hypothetical protein
MGRRPSPPQPKGPSPRSAALNKGPAEGGRCGPVWTPRTCFALGAPSPRNGALSSAILSSDFWFAEMGRGPNITPPQLWAEGSCLHPFLAA